MRNRLVLSGFVGLALATLSAGWFFYRDHPPNILIVHPCSVNRAHLSAYGYPRETMPNVAKLSENAIVFTNYTGRTSWRNFWATFFEEITGKRASLVSEFSRYPVFSVLQDLSNPRRVTQYYEKAYHYFASQDWSREMFRTELEPYRKLILDPKERPFFLTLQVKQAHFPYAGGNRHEIDYRFLLPRSRELFARYQHAASTGDPRFDLKLPVFGLLFGDKAWVSRAAKSVRGVSIPEDPLGLINSGYFLDRWKKSPEFQDDVQLLKDAYDSKLSYLDAQLGELLTLYGDRELQERTIVIFVGDHGTAFMEHGNLHNGQTPYEEVVGIPLIIHVPGLKGRRVVDAQFSEQSLFELVGGLLSGQVSGRNIEEKIREFSEPVVFSRDCVKSRYAVRWKGEWKLIQDVSGGARELYSLIEDPLETKNVAERHPGVVAQLEELILLHPERIEELDAVPCPTREVREGTPSGDAYPILNPNHHHQDHW